VYNVQRALLTQILQLKGLGLGHSGLIDHVSARDSQGKRYMTELGKA
jgi:hypothetical protein